MPICSTIWFIRSHPEYIFILIPMKYTQELTKIPQKDKAIITHNQIILSILLWAFSVNNIWVMFWLEWGGWYFQCFL